MDLEFEQYIFFSFFFIHVFCLKSYSTKSILVIFSPFSFCNFLIQYFSLFLFSFFFTFDPWRILTYVATLAYCKNIHRRRLTGSVSRPWIASFRDNRFEDDNCVHYDNITSEVRYLGDGTAFESTYCGLFIESPHDFRLVKRRRAFFGKDRERTMSIVIRTLFALVTKDCAASVDGLPCCPE